jgi:hypothetical protein
VHRGLMWNEFNTHAVSDYTRFANQEVAQGSEKIRKPFLHSPKRVHEAPRASRIRFLSVDPRPGWPRGGLDCSQYCFSNRKMGLR